MILKYFKYLVKSVDEHSIHSPFVFDFYLNVIKDQTPFYVFDQIEESRSELLSSNEKIEVADLGAGMKQNSGTVHTIRKIARNSSVSPKFGQLLFRMVNYFKPSVILEIGTSLGVSSMYLASPNKSSKIITMEGSPEKIRIAKTGFDAFNLSNIEVIEGNFDNELPKILKQYPQIDFVFIDGNHRKEPTINYFNLLMKNSHNETVMVFDDIHWSNGMEEAWNEIVQNKEVTITMDLFYFGIVFFKKELSKQNFVLRF